MRFRIPRHLGAAAMGLLALGLGGGVVLASPPGPNSDVAGAPPRTTQEGAMLAITVRTCPPAFDPTSTGADPLTECREPAGDTLFALSRAGVSGPSASTGTSGDAPQESTVTFSNLQPGDHRIAASAPPEVTAAFVWSCDSSERDIVAPFSPLTWIGPDGTSTVELLPGETLTCNWFQITSSSSI